ncbi:hypothetical protein N7447_000778 [Penicillium robsamsonii]|uniref:uncharacterized protein n=1 Tax=Penicillium robsamsonii TaxID=1792511 RepID=UPI002548E9F2|nr:uncharacterized protein N7447_000778 [Penicillium robsamsonii]KAJ5834752.1 hypothetical protein N7447_000778 [Penicillium robsamsonii]
MAGIDTRDDYLELGGSFLKDLPPSIKRYPYEGADSFFHILNLLPSGHDRTEFALFHASRETIEHLFSPINEGTTITSHCSSYDLTEELFLVKMPSTGHSVASGAVNLAITEPLRPMGLFNSLHRYGNGTVKGRDKGKEGDHGWGPRRPPPRYAKRPSVALEVAYSGSDSKLNSDVRFWLNPDDGNAKICLTLQIDSVKPRIRIEKWQLQNGRPHRSQIIWITKVSNQMGVTNHPLVIPFEDLFLRPPSTPAERDIQISKEALEDVADKIWDMQGL